MITGYGSVYLTENKTTTSGGWWGTTSPTKARALAANDLTVVLLRGNSNVDNNDQPARQRLPGRHHTGYNFSDGGQSPDSATGRWFVYGR